MGSSNSAVFCIPKTCTSSAPNDDAPASETQIGLSVTARTSATLSGQLLIFQWFQSRGKPCSATTSTASRTPWEAINRTKFGSMGEIPPRTIFRRGLTRRIACEAAFAISANIRHSGSILKSQWDRLLGSFQSITASTMRDLLAHLVFGVTGDLPVEHVAAGTQITSGTAHPCLGLGMSHQIQAGTAQHAFHGCRVGNPPVGGVAG